MEQVLWHRRLLVVTPPISGIIAYFMFISVQKLIFNTDQSLDNAMTLCPLLHVPDVPGHLPGDPSEGLTHVGAPEQWRGRAALRRHLHRGGVYRLDLYPRPAVITRKMTARCTSPTWKVFGILMIITACAMAFAHGSNDVANAIGPLSAVASIVAAGGDGGSSHIAWWIPPLGGIGIVIGLATMGER